MPKSSCPTPERILHAAYELFAAKGFDGATTQEICSLAQANIAAVNYHYGSKENLYRAVWEYGHTQASRLWDEQIDENASAEDRLRQFIGLRVGTVISDGERSWFSRLIHREITNPSPLIEELLEQYLSPKRKWFEAIIHDIVGENVPERIARLAGFCIHSPLIHLIEMKTREQKLKRLCPKDGGPTSDPEALADTIYTFALAGLHELQRRYQEEAK